MYINIYNVDFKIIYHFITEVKEKKFIFSQFHPRFPPYRRGNAFARLKDESLPKTFLTPDSSKKLERKKRIREKILLRKMKRKK